MSRGGEDYEEERDQRRQIIVEEEQTKVNEDKRGEKLKKGARILSKGGAGLAREEGEGEKQRPKASFHIF